MGHGLTYCVTRVTHGSIAFSANLTCTQPDKTL